MTITLTPSASGATSSQVPSRYDVIIDGVGYVFARQVDPNLPFRTQRGEYGFSPTFIPRSNVQGDFGDNQQDFYMTATQRNWVEGEQQKFFTQGNADSESSFWQGSRVNINSPGQVTIRQDTKSITVAAAIRAACPRGQSSSFDIVGAGATNLYEIDPAGAITDRGAHGLGATPSRFGIATDGTNVYVSTSSASTVGVRKWTGSGYTTWSATPADSLEFLNNSLYGLRGDTAELNVYSTTGVITQKFQWKDASGVSRAGTPGKVKAWGSKLLILWADGPEGAELWQYDGTNTNLVAQFPKNFYAHDVEVAFGTIFVSGSSVRISNGSTASVICRPAIFQIDTSSNLTKPWESPSELPAVSSVTAAGHPSVAALDNGFVFNDDVRGALTYYDLSTGATESIGTYTVAGDTPVLVSTQRMLLQTRNQTVAYLYPDTTTVAATATIDSSLFDFSSSLTKYFKSVLIDADVPSGASIDIAYQLNALDSSYTSLATGVASGTEYSIGANARSISIRITLNRGSSTTGPTLKRIFVRAAPIQSTFRTGDYILDCTGRDGKHPVILNDDTPESRDGFTLSSALLASAKKTSPITITDRFGTFMGIIDPAQFQLIYVREDELYARLSVRET